MATKLNELLAVEPDYRSQAESCRSDLKSTFEKKIHHFNKKVVTFKSNQDGVEDKVESQLQLQTTVKKELGWIGEKISKVLDAGHQIDVANTLAKADLVLENGNTLLKDVPATSLLRMEHRVTELRDLLHAVPTLDPAKGFELDPTEGDGIYKARDDSRNRTEKQFSYVVMQPPTDKHPAQIKELMLDKPVGVVTVQEWSSLITTADKGDMLDRVEALLRSIKKARARANDSEVDLKQNKIGAELLKHIIGA